METNEYHRVLVRAYTRGGVDALIDEVLAMSDDEDDLAALRQIAEAAFQINPKWHELLEGWVKAKTEALARVAAQLEEHRRAPHVPA